MRKARKLPQPPVSSCLRRSWCTYCGYILFILLFLSQFRRVNSGRRRPGRKEGCLATTWCIVVVPSVVRLTVRGRRATGRPTDGRFSSGNLPPANRFPRAQCSAASSTLSLCSSPRGNAFNPRAILNHIRRACSKNVSYSDKYVTDPILHAQFIEIMLTLNIVNPSVTSFLSSKV